jgi:hypothetical protein
MAADDPWAPRAERFVEVGLQASRRDPYRRLSRLFHLVARRGTGP